MYIFFFSEIWMKIGTSWFLWKKWHEERKSSSLARGFPDARDLGKGKGAQLNRPFPKFYVRSWVVVNPGVSLKFSTSISQLPNLFIGTPRICHFILLLIVWVRSFSKMLPSVKFAEDEVLVFVIKLSLKPQLI